MKVRTSLMLCVVAALCLANVAQAHTWNVADGNWNVPANWLENTLPASSVVINNNGVCNVDSAGLPNITTLALRKNSILNFLPGAALTGTGANNWLVGDADTGLTARVNQTGGTIVTGLDLYLGDDPSTSGEYYMSGGSLTVGDDLKCADDGGGKFVLSGNALFTVKGYISISNKPPEIPLSDGLTGYMEISGGTLIQNATSTDGADNHRFTVGESDYGVLKLIGGLATINVTTYEQRGTGTFDVVMNGTGISTINASEGMALAGNLVVSFAPGDEPANGIYDLIVAQGARTGEFGTVTLPPDVTLSYETGSSIVRLTVVPEPATLALLALGGLALRRRARK